MSGNEFHIGCQQDFIPQTPAEIAQKFLATLAAPAAISPRFSQWQVNIPETETSKPLAKVRSKFAEIVEAGIATDDEGPVPEEGYFVKAFTEAKPTPFSVTLEIQTGGSADYSRSMSFQTAYDMTPDHSIVSYPVFRSVLVTLASVWDIRSGQAYSSDLSERWDDPPFRYDLNWMVYLSAPLAAHIAAPKNVVVERTANGGLILIAAEETFDVSNPKHMAAAKSMHDALAPLNDLPGHARLKRQHDDTERLLAPLGLKRVR